jgi:hypothetical protein
MYPYKSIICVDVKVHESRTEGRVDRILRRFDGVLRRFDHALHRFDLDLYRNLDFASCSGLPLQYDHLIHGLCNLDHVV